MIKLLTNKEAAPVFADWEELERTKTLLYGASGAGKTYALRTFPRPLTVFNDWGGPLSLPRASDVHVIDLERKTLSSGKRVERSPTEKVELFNTNLNYLIKHPEEQPEVLAIDNFSQFYADTVRAVVEESGMKDQGGHYGIAQECWQVLMSRLSLLNCHVVLVCLEENRDGKIGPAVSPGMANAVNSWCDAVVRLVPVPDKAKEKKGSRALLTIATQTMTARVRGEAEILPPVIINPNFSEIIEAIMGATNGGDESEQATSHSNSPKES